MYGGVALIEKFDEDAQDQIHVSLVELRSVLQGALTILGRVSGISQSPPSASPQSSTPIPQTLRSNAVPPAASPAGRAKGNRSPLQLIRWGLRDKSKATAVVNHFTELNNRLLEKVQFLSLASAIGVEFLHLERLQQDSDSIQLGFDDDASLKLTISDTQMISESFELDSSWETVLQDTKRIENHFAIFEWSGRNMLQENCLYISGTEPQIEPQTRNRINALTKLLHQPKEQLFCILPCQGWRYLQHQKRIAYIFEMPSGTGTTPKSLLRLVGEPSLQPALGAKFNLAYGLARSIAQLHMVKWVHESFRSENVLFFPSSPETELPSTVPSATSEVDIEKPWIFGFEFSRPDAFFSAGYVDICPDRDVYRHPERQGQPLTTFKKTHDIYALGVVLLEIGTHVDIALIASHTPLDLSTNMLTVPSGMWRPAITLEKNHFAHAKGIAIANHLIKHAQKHLEKQMGEKYRDIVLKCLSGNFGVVDDTKEDLKLQQAFRAQVVEVLRKIVEIL